MTTKPTHLSSDSPPPPATPPAASKRLSKSAKKAQKTLEQQQEAFRRAASEPLRDPISGEVVVLDEHEFPEWPPAGNTPALDDDDWIGDAPVPNPAKTPPPPAPSLVHPITGEPAQELRDDELENPRKSPGLLSRLKAAFFRAFPEKEESGWIGSATPPPLPSQSGSPSQLFRTDSEKRAKPAAPSHVHALTGDSADRELHDDELEHRRPTLATRAKNAVREAFSLPEEDLWIGLPEERPAEFPLSPRLASAPQLDAGKKEQPASLPSTRRRPPADSPESSQLLQATHRDDIPASGGDFELATLSRRQEESEEDESGADREVAAIFHGPPQEDIAAPQKRPDAPPPGITAELHDLGRSGEFRSIEPFEIDDSPDSSGYTTPAAGYVTPHPPATPKAQPLQKPTPQRLAPARHDPSGTELGTLRPRPTDAGHLHTTAAPVVLEAYPPTRVESTHGTADANSSKPQQPVKAGLGLAVTATPSTNPPSTTPGRKKFSNLPIKWGKKTYYLTIDNVPPNLTREQVIAIITARLIKLSAAGDPSFHPGMAVLDLTFDTNEIRAEAAGSKHVFAANSEPEVAYYTAAMQTGRMDSLQKLPEYTATLESCRLESARVREPAKSTLYSERATESRPVRPSGAVRYIGFINLGNTCYVNAALQAIATNRRLRAYLLQDGVLPDLPYDEANRTLYGTPANANGAYTHPLKLVLEEYEARLKPGHPNYGMPIHPGLLIEYLRRERRIHGHDIQGDAQEAFLALLLDANPNLPGSPIRAQETQTSVRAVPHLASPDIHRARLGQSQFPLIQLTAPTTSYHLQAHLEEHFSDSPRLREPSAPDRIHRGFVQTPELLAVAVGRRRGNGTKNMIPITQPEQLALEPGWASNSSDIQFETDCIIYHYGTSGKQGHYVTIVKEPDPDHQGQFRYVELSDRENPRIITDFRAKEETASMIFYHRAAAQSVGQGLHAAWSGPTGHPPDEIEEV